MKTDLFQSCSHCWVFQICWYIECSTFTASSFRIWNISTEIPSHPLALFVVILPKAHLTSHSRMSGSRWVITPLWLSGSKLNYFHMLASVLIINMSLLCYKSSLYFKEITHIHYTCNKCFFILSFAFHFVVEFVLSVEFCRSEKLLNFIWSKFYISLLIWISLFYSESINSSSLW